MQSIARSYLDHVLRMRKKRELEVETPEGYMKLSKFVTTTSRLATITCVDEATYHSHDDVMTEPTRTSQNTMVDSDTVMVDQVFIGELCLQIDNNSGVTTSEIAAELDDMIVEECWIKIYVDSELLNPNHMAS